MTSHVGRLYVVALALVVFFLAWAVVAARPWTPVSADPRARILAVRAAQLRREAKLVSAVVAARRAHAPAPAVRVVNLPPITVTRTS
jgi:hypothetical protein